ncbi:succinate dehydrogenase cytochrome b subunit [Nostocoides sp.]|uniref:succinate dehydrogenase cytochrome b subunit n=1 Tax=Nostocoides sp. TaxID=1917966 RepID=UPI002CD02961|nr:succinate dehydrogenase cytochrome b subunit [Tetrasphaera sp.]
MRSSIGLKLLMAATGLIFVGYVLLHAYGNLMVLGGAEQFNTYAHHLRTFGQPILPYEGLLWIVRVVLLASLVLHAYSAFTLWGRANSARSTKYVVKKAVASSLASRTMRFGGLALLLFVVFHILHLTTHTITPQGDQATPYANVVNSFDKWWLVVIYALAVTALALHLTHGIWSAAQTLGLTSNAAARSRAKIAGHFVAALVWTAFLIPPLAILFGIVD